MLPDESLFSKYTRDDLNAKSHTVTDYPMTSNPLQRFNSDHRSSIADKSYMKKDLINDQVSKESLQSERNKGGMFKKTDTYRSKDFCST